MSSDSEGVKSHLASFSENQGDSCDKKIKDKEGQFVTNKRLDIQ